MREELKGLEKLVSGLPKDTRVLDVGAGGLEGENTSHYLIDKFGKGYTGITIRKDVADKYAKLKPGSDIIHDDFYKHKFKEKFDLIVLDLNIENNVKDWQGDGVYPMVWELLKRGGKVVSYVMSTTDYGEKETGEMLEKHHKRFWDTNDFTIVNMTKALMYQYESVYDVLAIEQEVRRPYIYWVMLKKI